MYSQARTIIDKFGGGGLLAKALGKSRSTVYRWDYPVGVGGTGGVIPLRNHDAIKAAAKVRGIKLKDKDFQLT